MMKKTMTAVAVVALGASLAFAAPGDWKGHGGHDRAGLSEKMAQKLNLTDAQKAQVKSLRDQVRTDNAAFIQNFRQTMQDVRAAKQANDTVKLDALRPTVESQKAQMKILRQAQRDKIRNILTADQRAQLDALKAQHEAREKK